MVDRGFIFAVKRLKEQSGCSLVDCKKALEVCEGLEGVAYEYLKLKSCAVARYRIVNFKKVPWKDKDYVEEAKRAYSASIKSV